MNRFPSQGQYRHFPPRNPQTNSSRMVIPPPPLPPWVNQPCLPPASIPPPPVPPSFPPNPPFPRPDFRTMPPFQPTSNIPLQSSLDSISESELAKAANEKCSDSQKDIDTWIMRKGIMKKAAKQKPKSTIQIHTVREKLNAVLSLIKELENGARTLSVMVKTVSDAEWDQKCQEIERKKHQLMEKLRELNLSEEDVKTFQEKTSKRLKKRQRLKRQKEKRKKAKEEEEIETRNKHVQLDNWLREKQEGVERAQREEELKREADAVLYVITHKKNEARRQASLLSALLELRQVRVKRLTAAGRPISETQIQVFNTVIEGLQKLWTQHLDEIALEEQTLRAMLTMTEVTEDPVKSHKKIVLQEWENAIFGVVGSLDFNLKKGEELLDLRRTWDQFAVPEHTVLSSTIPPGWVLPVPPSSEEWHKLLKY